MRVPILCYHRIEAPPIDSPDDSNFTTPSLFAAHLAALERLGCTGVTVGAIARWQRGEGQLPARAVAITFDDAYASLLDSAIPRLESMRWTSTIFAVAGEIGGTNAWDTAAPRAELLDASSLQTLAGGGHEIGSHSSSHTRLTGLTDARLIDELGGSRDALQQRLSLPIHSIAFPYGSHDRRVLQQVHDAGYTASCTLKRWANSTRSNPLRLGRMSVGGRLPTWQLLGKLTKLMLTPARS